MAVTSNICITGLLVLNVLIVKCYSDKCNSYCERGEYIPEKYCSDWDEFCCQDDYGYNRDKYCCSNQDLILTSQVPNVRPSDCIITTTAEYTPVGLIVGIVVGVIILVAVICGIIGCAYCCCCKASSKPRQGHVMQTVHTGPYAQGSSQTGAQPQAYPSSGQTQVPGYPSSGQTQVPGYPSSGQTQRPVYPSSGQTQGPVYPSSGQTQGPVYPSTAQSPNYISNQNATRPSQQYNAPPPVNPNYPPIYTSPPAYPGN